MARKMIKLADGGRQKTQNRFDKRAQIDFKASVVDHTRVGHAADARPGIVQHTVDRVQFVLDDAAELRRAFDPLADWSKEHERAHMQRGNEQHNNENPEQPGWDVFPCRAAPQGCQCHRDDRRGRKWYQHGSGEIQGESK